MLSDEEKKAIVELNHFSNMTAYWKQAEYTNSEIDNYIKLVLNLIEKQQKEIERINEILTWKQKHEEQLQKEIEELKQEKEYLNCIIESDKDNYINKDKIKAKIEDIETPKKVIKFLNEIDNICKKYNFSISHEDSHGAFILEKYDDYNIKWLKDCMLDLEED